MIPKKSPEVNLKLKYPLVLKAGLVFALLDEKCELKKKSYPDSLYLPFGYVIQLGYHVFSTFSLQLNEEIVFFGVM